MGFVLKNKHYDHFFRTEQLQFELKAPILSFSVKKFFNRNLVVQLKKIAKN
jgi:hypothetical protein